MSDSENEENFQYELQKYSLVKFIHRGRKRQIESVDIVPSKWLDYDKNKARCITKFMEGPYEKEDLKLIHDLVIRNSDAPEDWPTFSIEQVGRAKSYSEALQKIKKLQTDEHVLTLESEDSASEVQKKLTLAVKGQKLQAEANKIKSKLSSTTNQNNESQGIRDVTNTQAAQSDRNIRDEQFIEMRKDSPSKKTTSISNALLESKSVSRQSKIKTTISCEGSSSSTAAFEVKYSPAVLENVLTVLNSPQDDKAKTTEDELVEKSKDGALTDQISPVSEVVEGFSEQDKCKLESSSGAVLQNLSLLDESIFTDAPIYCSNVKCKSSFEVAVMMRLDQMTADLAEMKTDLAALKSTQAATTNFLADKQLIAKSTSDLESKYQLKLPFSTYIEFEAFEEKLKEDVFFKKDVYIDLKLYVDKDLGISKCIVKMLKRFFSKDLAKQFSAVRSSVTNKSKYKFRPTELCNMIEAIITKLRKEKALDISHEDFNSSLTDVLTNVPKWK